MHTLVTHKQQLVVYVLNVLYVYICMYNNHGYEFSPTLVFGSGSSQLPRIHTYDVMTISFLGKSLCECVEKYEKMVLFMRCEYRCAVVFGGGMRRFGGGA